MEGERDAAAQCTAGSARMCGADALPKHGACFWKLVGLCSEPVETGRHVAANLRYSAQARAWVLGGAVEGKRVRRRPDAACGRQGRETDAESRAGGWLRNLEAQRQVEAQPASGGEQGSEAHAGESRLGGLRAVARQCAGAAGDEAQGAEGGGPSTERARGHGAGMLEAERKDAGTAGHCGEQDHIADEERSFVRQHECVGGGGGGRAEVAAHNADGDT